MRRVPPIFSPTAPLLPYPTLCRSLDIHLGQCRHQRLLRPLVALEQLGREAPGTVLRHPQLQLADPRHQRARVMPRTVAEPRIAALALARASRSEEHTSELQSLMRTSYAVFCLEKKIQRAHIT